MNPHDYHAFIKQLQEKEFPGEIDHNEHIPRFDGSYIMFAPSHHFRPASSLMTKELVDDLSENGKKILSVGCGPAYLERLLVSRLGVDKDQITLADISSEYVPEGFRFYQFDMHKDWPSFDRTYDYVLFPESVLLNVNFSSKRGCFIGLHRQPERERGLSNILYRSLSVLNKPGQVRMTSGVMQIVKQHVKRLIESQYPDVTMGYEGELTYVDRN